MAETQPQPSNTHSTQLHTNSTINLKLAIASVTFLCIGGVIGYALGAKSQSAPQGNTAIPIVSNSPLSNSNMDSELDRKMTGCNGEVIGDIVDDNLCRVRIPIEEEVSYEVTYPRGWALDIRGAAGTNLYLNGSENEPLLFTSPQGVFIGVSVAELPLEESYKAVSRYEQAVDPVVNEPIKNYALRQVNDKSILVVNTSDSQRDFQYQLFQLTGNQHKWLIDVKTLGGITDQSFLTKLDQIIISIKLVPGGSSGASQ